MTTTRDSSLIRLHSLAGSHVRALICNHSTAEEHSAPTDSASDYFTCESRLSRVRR